MTCGDKQGTTTGHSRHKQAGEEPCAACYTARRSYEQEHKRRARAAGRVAPESPHTVAQHRRYIAARGRALTRIAHMYPQVMARLLAEELGDDDLVDRKPYKWKATG